MFIFCFYFFVFVDKEIAKSSGSAEELKNWYWMKSKTHTAL
jgi:hypothetical protein